VDSRWRWRRLEEAIRFRVSEERRLDGWRRRGWRRRGWRRHGWRREVWLEPGGLEEMRLEQGDAILVLDEGRRLETRF
jgi:hypothetical protein